MALRVLMVGGDLMFESRLRQALPGAEVRVARSAAAAGAAAVGPGSTTGATGDLGEPDSPATSSGGGPGADLVVVDLNREAPTRVELIAELRSEHPQLAILGFCHHGERELRSSAMAAGATEVVTNGSVPEAAGRLAGIEASSRRR